MNLRLYIFFKKNWDSFKKKVTWDTLSFNLDPLMLLSLPKHICKKHSRVDAFYTRKLPFGGDSLDRQRPTRPEWITIQYNLCTSLMDICMVDFFQHRLQLRASVQKCPFLFSSRGRNRALRWRFNLPPHKLAIVPHSLIQTRLK